MESKLIQSDNFVNLQSKPNIPFMKKLAFIILTAGCVISCTGTSEKQEKISGDTVRQSYEVSVGRPSGKVEIRLEKDTILPNENRVGLTIRNNSPHTIQTGRTHFLISTDGTERNGNESTQNLQMTTQSLRSMPSDTNFHQEKN